MLDYRKNLQFIADNNLIQGVRKRIAVFDSNIEMHQQIIEREKIYSTQSDLDKFIHLQFRKMAERVNVDSNFVALIKILAEQ